MNRCKSATARKRLIAAMAVCLVATPCVAEYTVRIPTSTFGATGSTGSQSGGSGGGSTGYTQAERESIWDSWAQGLGLEPGTGYDPDWNWIDANSMGISELPDAPYPNPNPTGDIHLFDNPIDSIDSLSSLQSVHSLNLKQMNITHVDALSSLASADNLNLSDNAINDISGLSNLATVVGYLWLKGNNITDLSPLSSAGLTVDTLIVYGNPYTDMTTFEGITVIDKTRMVDLGGVSGVTKADGSSNFCTSFEGGGGSAVMMDDVGYEWTMIWSEYCQ